MKMFDLLFKSDDLTEPEYVQIANELFSGNLNNPQLAAALGILNTKEINDQLIPFAKVMRENSIKFETNVKNVVDTCGTGGDGRNTFNISTASALISCAAGVKIAKHGNRAASGKTGSADVIEELGIKIQEPAMVSKTLEKTGFGFLFAPYFHPKLKEVAKVRRELGFRTVFNLLGPLCNPAKAKRQLIGVYNRTAIYPMVNALMELGCANGLVVNSEGMDEIGLGSTNVAEIKNGSIEEYELDAKDFGFTSQDIPKVSNANESAKIILEVLSGRDQSGARDISILNAAAAIYVSDLAGSIEQGIKLAANSIDSGMAQKKLEEIKLFSN
ncbi:anthranilate phosphoribosyltransferase [Candidatus Micrarchaeota archaeon]|nr:anthranilate phosphoribosyltransferase [Candidatus Micrarchaeota archaeon]